MDLQQIPMNIFIFSASSREVKMGAFWLRWCLFKKYIFYFLLFLKCYFMFFKIPDPLPPQEI